MNSCLYNRFYTQFGKIFMFFDNYSMNIYPIKMNNIALDSSLKVLLEMTLLLWCDM
jgi:hypothetical protein